MTSPERWSVRRLLNWSTPWLEKQGVENPRLDSELLLAHAIGLKRLDLFLDPDRPLIPAELARFKSLIKRRAHREPTALILGIRGFWKLDFLIHPGVLIPRPESERIIEAVLEKFPDQESPLALLDIGVGPGTLLFTLLSEYPQATGVGCDLSQTALACARENGEALKLLDRTTLLQGDLTAPLDTNTRFDLIVSNPPYITDKEMADLAPEVREWEPREALWGGEDGLDLYRRLLPDALPFLKAQGVMMVEIGHTQGEAVARLMTQAGFCEVTILLDYGRRSRVVVGVKGNG
ncbi:MAG: peptide chain release factor N(5)-glutamine methyltransferase [Magnetococcales bacterium]|nr:peptide chain release factor N(5)-glutamine methyltransferase [Magnetococcales bacterium]